jgi:hypothetical protein
VAVVTYVCCPGCGRGQPPARLGLSTGGRFDPDTAAPNELSLRIDHIGGRGMLRVERQPLPLPFAIGIRDMLRARLERVEAELAAAGVHD